MILFLIETNDGTSAWDVMVLYDFIKYTWEIPSHQENSFLNYSSKPVRAS